MKPRLFARDVKPVQMVLGKVVSGVRARAQRTLEQHVEKDEKCTFCERAFPCDAVRLAKSVLEVK